MTDPEAPVELVLDVGAPAAGGSFVARAQDGHVVFVRHALPGERVRAVVTQQTASYLRADAVEVLSASADRVDAPCPYARPGGCGGCDYQHVALPRQRLLKGELVAEQLQRLAGVALVPEVEEVPGAPDGLGWRTRVQFAVDAQGRPGLHRHRSRELELVDRCLIAAPDVAAVGAERSRWPEAQSVEVAGAQG
jgi:tRNA/tmRNA/rRNA uracil-C5-methylase (TrmA/RlmC/RlmD family)